MHILKDSDNLPNPLVLKGYLLPFKNLDCIKISQGYEGPFSHLPTLRGEALYDDRFSIDFALPLNMPILASKSGIVWGRINTHLEYYLGTDIAQGLSTPSNFIVLEHFDKTLTLYSHIDKNMYSAKRGKPVKQGETIAFTGLSGWIGETPHLHFEAFKFSKSSRFSFPTSFINYRGPIYHKDLS